MVRKKTQSNAKHNEIIMKYKGDGHTEQSNSIAKEISQDQEST
jgi:hypothetical protein